MGPMQRVKTSLFPRFGAALRGRHSSILSLDNPFITLVGPNGQQNVLGIFWTAVMLKIQSYLEGTFCRSHVLKNQLGTCSACVWRGTFGISEKSAM